MNGLWRVVASFLLENELLRFIGIEAKVVGGGPIRDVN